jgi:hypothetical protein
VELPFRIKFSLSRKLKGYEFPAIAKQQNVMQQLWNRSKKRKNRSMIKRIFILGIMMSLVQTLLYFSFVEMLQFAETKFAVENNRQITDTILPYIVLIFFEITLIQNILTSIVNRQLFTWIMFSLSSIFLLAAFFKPFSIWPSVPFSLIIILLLLSYVIVEKRYRKIISKPIA